MRVSYPIVRLSYPIVRVSYQVFRLSYRENRLSGFCVYQVLSFSCESGKPLHVHVQIRAHPDMAYIIFCLSGY